YEEIKIIRFPLMPFYKDFVFYIYFIDGLLIDTGPRLRKSLLAPEFKQLPIKKVALTHHHDDHRGMGGGITRNRGVDIYSHEETIPHIQKKKYLRWIYRLGRIIAREFTPIVYPDVLETAHHQFIPIHTTRHTNDHRVLYKPTTKWLFTGDLYTKSHPKVDLKSDSIKEYIDSLEKLLPLDFDTLFCAHEGVIPDGKERIKEKINYLKRMQKSATEMHEEGFTDK